MPTPRQDRRRPPRPRTPGKMHLLDSAVHRRAPAGGGLSQAEPRARRSRSEASSEPHRRAAAGHAPGSRAGHSQHAPPFQPRSLWLYPLPIVRRPPLRPTPPNGALWGCRSGGDAPGRNLPAPRSSPRTLPNLRQVSALPRPRLTVPTHSFSPDQRRRACLLLGASVPPGAGGHGVCGMRHPLIPPGRTRAPPRGARNAGLFSLMLHDVRRFQAGGAGNGGRALGRPRGLLHPAGGSASQGLQKPPTREEGND